MISWPRVMRGFEEKYCLRNSLPLLQRRYTAKLDPAVAVSLPGWCSNVSPGFFCWFIRLLSGSNDLLSRALLRWSPPLQGLQGGIGGDAPQTPIPTLALPLKGREAPPAARAGS